jgi:hypothetical protein
MLSRTPFLFNGWLEGAHICGFGLSIFGREGLSNIGETPFPDTPKTALLRANA